MSLYSSAGTYRSRGIFDRGVQLRADEPVYVIGAGRNIAENLRLLGRKVSLITITDDDAYGDIIREQCRKAGIDLRFSFAVPAVRMTACLQVNEEKSDIQATDPDMSIYELLTPLRLKPLLPVLNKGAMLIADANLPEETLGWLVRHITIPMAADPVSHAKAERLRPLLSGLTLIAVNIPEAEVLTGIEIREDGDPGRAADTLHRLGVRRVYISLSGRGVWADDLREGGELISCFPGSIMDSTDYGDTFTAAAADAFLSGLNTFEAARHALAASSVCAKSHTAENPGMS